MYISKGVILCKKFMSKILFELLFLMISTGLTDTKKKKKNKEEKESRLFKK